MLNKTELHQLDGQLELLRQELSERRPYGLAAGHARKILESVTAKPGTGMEGKLLADRWDEEDKRFRIVGTAHFGDVDHDDTAQALHTAFVKMVEFAVSAKTARRKKQYAEQLLDALSDYLDLRGYPEPENNPREDGQKMATTAAGEQGERAGQSNAKKRVGRKPVGVPEAEKRLYDDYVASGLGSHMEFARARGLQLKELNKIIERVQTRLRRSRQKRADKRSQ